VRVLVHQGRIRSQAEGGHPGRAAQLVQVCACPDCFSDLADIGDLQCTKCGHTFATTSGIPVLLPSTMDSTQQRYLDCYNDIAADDLTKPFEGNRPARHRTLKKFIGSVRGKRVLDIGSSDAIYLREMDAKLKVALDLAIGYLKTIPDDAGIIPICGDAERLPVRAGIFDVVVIADVLEHVLSPERVVARLLDICRPDTRLIVHVPWEEDLGQYREAGYEFTHLRSFNAYNFSLLFRDFYERRSRGTYPNVISPLPYRLYGRVPRRFYNLLMFVLRLPRLGDVPARWWAKWIEELPRREGWLLLFYPPVYRMFELSPLRGTIRFRLALWLRDKLLRQAAKITP